MTQKLSLLERATLNRLMQGANNNKGNVLADLRALIVKMERSNDPSLPHARLMLREMESKAGLGNNVVALPQAREKPTQTDT